MWHRVLGTCRGLGGIVVLGGALVTLALAGCSGPSVAGQPTTTATPSQRKDATCGPNGTPVGAEFTQQTCAVSTRDGTRILHATYTGGQVANRLDPKWLIEGGWQQVDGYTDELNGGTSGYDAYFSGGAWLVDQWGTPKGQHATLTLDIGTPLSAQAACGQQLTASGTVQQGLPLPKGYITVFAGPRTVNIVPACLDDVRQFYTAAIPAQGGRVNEAFPPASDFTPANGLRRVKASVYTGRGGGGGVNEVTLAGGANTPTEVVLGQLSRPQG